MGDAKINVTANFDKAIAKEYAAHVADLRQQLETVTRERDNAAKMMVKNTESAIEDRRRLVTERDEARRWAAAWKRSAKMWRSWCVDNMRDWASEEGIQDHSPYSEYEIMREASDDLGL